MSEQQPPASPGSKKPAQTPPDKGVNWKVIILFTIALAIIFVAIDGASDSDRETLKFTEFREALLEGRVLQTVSKDYKNGKLELVTFTGEARAEITGRYSEETVLVKQWDDQTPIKAIVQVDIDSISNDLDETFGEKLNWVVEAPGQDASAQEVPFSRIKTLLSENKLVLGKDVQFQIFRELNSNVATLYATKGKPVAFSPEELEELAKDENDAARLKGFQVKLSASSRGKLEALIDSGISTRNQDNTFGKIMMSLLPVLLLIVLIFFLFRHQMKSAGRGAMSFGKSKAKLLTMDQHKVTFKDVAGIQEAKEELYEIVDFLRDPRKFQALGGTIPKGVLMVGPPGTGKTLLARAISGEADVPFFSISGSDFVEMFVGVGASRVRDMFEQGKKHAPCLVFIDEIDAVGRHRGQGMGGGHDEREQTLNALLVEMDGFDTQEGVIIIAATNRPDVLDPALLRPGRFDRQVTVSLPDVKGREQILDVHAKKIKLAAGTDLAVIARGTPGFSGAELANLINEAALLAARKGIKAVTLAEMEEARDKVRWGRERRSLALSDKEKKNTAYHEAGHAILNEVLDHTDPLHKVTIIPRGPSLGSTMFLPDEDRFNYRKNELLSQLIVLMGGRVAEEIIFGDVTNGAMGDIRMATNLARKMVCEWGMSTDLGMVEYGDGGGGGGFLSRDMMGQSKNYSEDTAQKIDNEIKDLIDHAYKEAERLLKENRTLLDKISEALLEFETLDAKHIKDLMEHGEMKDPPKPPEPPEIPDDMKKEKAPESTTEEKRDDDGTLPPEVVGAPA
ncbi:ATP-dependent zinc metalloprotease FtsH [Akkermansiaceae bacterium]|nr:ATP-dependent zinc metalloprotease FtsH [Akkermansiaceae bacterium]MDB4383615.1 ATP-dependent zinc metalloprotease FtsH [Akkermansiaceae bacterium]MDB4466401.1 ATP-dependent zinc metalloprotease FtsH [bacterium]MDB4502089.1 ATP-dependent zinc metalloprotease FtsH [Akkermansiaceae bacterium]MDB4509750.1 ATP-dependent zinc metalloprotease FtsH [Akkermansiaceae bacterium]